MRATWASIIRDPSADLVDVGSALGVAPAGAEGINVVARLTGFLLICIGVQFVGSGIPQLHGWHLSAAIKCYGRPPKTPPNSHRSLIPRLSMPEKPIPVGRRITCWCWPCCPAAWSRRCSPTDFASLGFRPDARRGQSPVGRPRRRHRQREVTRHAADPQHRRTEPDIAGPARPGERQDVSGAASVSPAKLNDHLGGPAIFGRPPAAWSRPATGFSDNLLGADLSHVPLFRAAIARHAGATRGGRRAQGAGLSVRAADPRRGAGMGEGDRRRRRQIQPARTGAALAWHRMRRP